MKKTAPFILFLLAAAFATRAAAQNLIDHGDFENVAAGLLQKNSSPWAGEEANNVEVMNDGRAHSGSQEAVIHPTYSGQLLKFFNCQPNTNYVATAWIATSGLFSNVDGSNCSQPNTQCGSFAVSVPTTNDVDGDGDTQAGFSSYFFDGSMTLPGGSGVALNPNTNGGYQQYSFTFNSGNNTTLMMFVFVVTQANGINLSDTLIDDISIVPVVDPPPPPPPQSLPIQFTGATLPETHSVVVPLTVPANATAATLQITCFDCDHTDFGSLVINGGAPMAMWVPIGVGNATAVLNVPGALSSLINGNNTFTFTKTGNYGGGTVSAIAATFTLPAQSIPPAAPGGVTVQ